MSALAGRRAVLRWGWRLFRREWRQQLTVLALLTVGVATMTYLVALAHNAASTGVAGFGSADVRFRFGAADPDVAAADVALARDFYDDVDVLTLREVPLPGSAKGVVFRSLDPSGTFTGPMLALRAGHYPTGDDDVALTEELAGSLRASVGDRVELDGRQLHVVGLVENPGQLDDEFVLTAPSDHVGSVDEVWLLVDGDLDQADEFREMMAAPGNVDRQTPFDDQTTATVGTLALATLGMLLVALIAVSGFLVMAQRRLRQLGLLAAVGATPRQVRLVTLVDGLVVGAAAAVVGTVVGLAVWAATMTSVEGAVGHRIDGLSVPVWAVAVGMALAIITGAGAAWWPARMAAGMPVHAALSRRPPKPRSTHRSAAVAIALMVSGVACLSRADGDRPLFVIAGTLLTPIGMLLLAPIAVRVFSRLAARLPLAGRLALRDLGRNQARSGSALAAIGLCLGVPVAIIVVANAEKASEAEGNLSNSQLLVRAEDAPERFVIADLTSEQVEALDLQVDQLSATLDDAAVVPLDMALDRDTPGEPGLVDADEVKTVEMLWLPPRSDLLEVMPLYVATPEVFEHFGVDPAETDAHDFVSAHRRGEFSVAPDAKTRQPMTVTDVGEIDDLGYTALPRLFVSPAAADRHGWETMRAAWLVETSAPLTDEQIADAQDWAAAAGLTIESRDRQSSIASLQAGATVAGMLLALGVLALTVGLIRGEVSGDLRTLAATGASDTIRRTLTAATAAALAVLGVVLGVAGAYLVMVGAYHDRLGDLTPVPVLHLVALAVGVPVLAAGTSWLVARRQPPAVAID